MDIGYVRVFGRDGFHGIHVTKGSSEDQVEALAGKAAEYSLRIGAFGNVLDVGYMHAGYIVLYIGQAVKMSLRPTAVVMRANENKRDVKLS